MQSIGDAIRWTSIGNGQFENKISESWFQGRGAFGGIVGASFLRCFRTMVEELGEAQIFYPKSLTVQFCKPVASEKTICRCEIDRKGKSVLHLSAKMLQGEEIVATSLAVFGIHRHNDAFFTTSVFPTKVAFEDAIELPKEMPGVPAFYSQLKYYMTDSPQLFSGSESAYVHAWCNNRDQFAFCEELMAIYLDATAPALLTHFSKPTGAATVSLTYQFLRHSVPESMTHAPFLVYTKTQIAGHGYAEESAECWGTDGKLYGQGHQIVTFF